MPDFPVNPNFGVDRIVPTSTALPVLGQAFPRSDATLESQQHSRGLFGSTESHDISNSGQDTPNSEAAVAENLNLFFDFACDMDFFQHGYLRSELAQSLPNPLLPHSEHPVESTGPRSLAVLDSTSDLTTSPTWPQGIREQAAHLDQSSDMDDFLNLPAISSVSETPQNRMQRQTSRGPRKARTSNRSPKGKNPCRGPFRNSQERLETGQTRKIGACLRCRMQKVRVSKPSFHNGERYLTASDLVCHQSGGSQRTMSNVP